MPPDNSGLFAQWRQGWERRITDISFITLLCFSTYTLVVWECSQGRWMFESLRAGNEIEPREVQQQFNFGFKAVICRVLFSAQVLWSAIHTATLWDCSLLSCSRRTTPRPGFSTPSWVFPVNDSGPQAESEEECWQVIWGFRWGLNVKQVLAIMLFPLQRSNLLTNMNRELGYLENFQDKKKK